jgi:hypothetical protein
MIQAIWKYQLRTAGTTSIIMPERAEVLHVDKQRTDNELFIWMLVYPASPKKLRQFHVIGTGHQVEDSQLGKHLGTVLLMDDNIVVHVFEGV